MGSGMPPGLPLCADLDEKSAEEAREGVEQCKDGPPEEPVDPSAFVRRCVLRICTWGLG